MTRRPYMLGNLRRRKIDVLDSIFVSNLSWAILIALAVVGLPYYLTGNRPVYAEPIWYLFEGLALAGFSFRHSVVRLFDDEDLELVDFSQKAALAALLFVAGAAFLGVFSMGTIGPSAVVFYMVHQLAAGLSIGQRFMIWNGKSLVFMFDEV